MCDHNDGTGRYDCAEPYTKKISGCHAYYLVPGYHGHDQNEAAYKYNENRYNQTTDGDDEPNEGTDGDDEPMIICVK